MTNNAMQRRTPPTSSNPACDLTGADRPHRHIALESERNYLWQPICSPGLRWQSWWRLLWSML